MDSEEARYQMYPVALVKVSAGRRALKEETVLDIMSTSAQVGVLEPILLNIDGTLVAGAHRLEAARRMGLSSVPAMVRYLSPIDAAIAELVENFASNPLVGLDKAEATAKYKRLLEEKYPEAKSETVRLANLRQGTSRSDTVSLRGNGDALDETVSLTVEDAPVASITVEIAKTMGMSERSVQRDIQIAEDIAPEVKAMIRDTPVADHKTDLLAIARAPVEEQRAVAEERIERRALPMEDYRARRNAMRKEREEEEARTQAELDRVARFADPKGLLARNKIQEAYRDNLDAAAALFKMNPETLIPILSSADHAQLQADILGIRQWCGEVEAMMAPGPRAMGGR